jgi:transmembrane sensor
MGKERPVTAAHATARKEAIDWAILSHDADFGDWEALEDWLASDPLHAELYDRATIGADDAALGMDDGKRISLVPAPLPIRRPVRWFPFALAASLVAALAGGSLYYRADQRPATYAVSTPAGERRTFTVDGAATIELNGDTQVTLDRANPRTARIDRGQALFTVSHDAQHPFTVKAGGVTITDVGTVFEVERLSDVTNVAVAEGAVRLTSDAGAIDLTAGRAASIGATGTSALVRDEDRTAIGSWRSDRIDFADITLDDLAERIHRATGARIEISPTIARRRVTGSIAVHRDAEAAVRSLGSLLGLRVSQHGDTWAWSARDVASPS